MSVGRNAEKLLSSLSRFLDTVEQMDMGPLDHLTCSEAGALAELMTADRGREAGMWVIIHHMTDGDNEEEDELISHLEAWPGLEVALRKYVAADTAIIDTLNALTAGKGS